VIVYGNERLREWASFQLFGHADGFDEKAKAIGVEKNGSIIASVVYTDYHPHMIEMHIASIDKTWATRHTLRTFFSYPFIQLKLERVQAILAASNEGAISMAKRLGFTFEGNHPKAFRGGVDAVSYGMLKSDCRWL